MKQVLLASVLVLPLTGWAQQEMKPIDAKPGLWENTTTTQMSGMAMPAISEEQLAKLPPEQRARVEAMLKGSGGGGSPRTTTHRACVTSENLSKPLFDNGDKSCTTKLLSSTSNSQTIHLECTPNPNTKMAGDLKIVRIDGGHFKGDVTMKATTDATAGRSLDIKGTYEAKWISSDCGDVKPNEGK